MRELKINLSHCFGIGKLNHTLEFDEDQTTHSIYAANGVMKTSFARTFLELSKGDSPVDLAFPEAKTTWDVLVDDIPIQKEQIYVIKPYVEDYQSKEVSLLVANEDLRKRHQETVKKLEDAKSQLVNILAEKSGIKKKEDLEQQMREDFAVGDSDPDRFFITLNRVKNEITEDLTQYATIKYNEIFNEKTKDLFEDNKFKEHIEPYIEKYDSLLEQSNFFKKGHFNIVNADNVAERLDKDGYFEAAHKLTLSLKGEPKTINSKNELKAFIESEKNQILDDPDLREIFNELLKKLDKNVNSRQFEKYLFNNRHVLGELRNFGEFKQKIWKSYLLENQDLYNSTLNQFEETKEALKEIRKEMTADRGKWGEIIEKFNDRFHATPFRVEIKNKIDVIVGGESPAFSFTFTDKINGESRPMESKEILTILSRGESRALYLLNVIYEIEIRKESDQETLYIIDDIADSFDYKNKYAIIEYLHELSKQNSAKLIILTHNFDFYRSVSGRLGVKRNKRWHAIKNKSNEVTLRIGEYHKNPMKTWINEWDFRNEETIEFSSKTIASVPMVREIVSLMNGDAEIFHNALHYKDGSDELSLGEIVTSMRSALKTSEPYNEEKLWMNFVRETANRISENCSDSTNADNLKLEEKITLSIDIRLHTENFIVNYFRHENIPLHTINKNQTIELIELFKKERPDKLEILEILEKVAIMTPEAIHLNSFMYEPILDMSGQHLVQLHNKIKSTLKLNNTNTVENK